VSTCPVHADLPSISYRGCDTHMKIRHEESGSLTDAEGAFIGHYPERRSNGNGWRSVGSTDLDEIGSGSFQDLRGVRYLFALGDMRLELQA
jgi:hypothetical protein